MVLFSEDFYIDSSHLLVTRPSNSTALELLLLETAEKSPHTSLQMQFIFQNYLQQFALTPTTDKFRLCQDMFNRILSAQTNPPSPKFRQHIPSGSIVVGGIMGAMAVPALMGLSAVVAGRQARRERTFDDDEGRQTLQRSKSMTLRAATTIGSPTLKDLSNFRAQTSTSLDVRRPLSSRGSTLPPSSPRTSSGTHFSNKHSALMSISSPNLQPPSPHRPSPLRSVSPVNFSDENVTGTLMSHYYSTQTQFLQCLQDISLRLRLVPKAARQSALRIELSGLDKWLPADVCLTNICSSSEAHDRVVQIVGSDCTILNSAERVFPYEIKRLIIGPISIASGSFEGGSNLLCFATTKQKTFPRNHDVKSLIPPIRSQHHHTPESLSRSVAQRTLPTQLFRGRRRRSRPPRNERRR